VLTIIGLQFAFLLAGAIIIENVFYLPGLGRLVFQAITQRDLIVVKAVVMLLVFRGHRRQPSGRCPMRWSTHG
jgi:peptide/nickel transport system permease protein